MASVKGIFGSWDVLGSFAINASLLPNLDSPEAENYKRSIAKAKNDPG
jgi:hypothetical protein